MLSIYRLVIFPKALGHIDEESEKGLISNLL
ncbi:hypothetical protein Godav_024083 [Gossypium davidsonii]|uniref:Uncharacterized protein n=1 Tax=Gossypium davidsonii TaxID=34287 RepID=A0A7J8SUC6_GOSDV|nr:hypothetical protein [Gossypium davidsonii]